MAKSCESVSTFLNRLLALPLRQQQLLFQFFGDTMDALTDEAKSKGQYDEGIVSIKAQVCAGGEVEPPRLLHRCNGWGWMRRAEALR